jgi:hypothetical protein
MDSSIANPPENSDFLVLRPAKAAAMIEVRYRDRLGNNLFQYCLGRILAEALGFAMEAPPLAGFPGTRAQISGDRHDAPPEVLTGQRIDFDRLLADRTPRKIILDGWFQRREYYRPFQPRIRQWLALDPSIQVPSSGDRLVVHVRRLDYVTTQWALPFSFYEEAIERAGAGNEGIWIVTDAPTDPFFRRFKKFRPNFFSGSALEDLAFMTQSRRLVISQSTFSWWPAFLGNQAKVYAPVPKTGIWAGDIGGNNPNLIEKDRFICLECREGYQPNSWEFIHEKWRRFKRRQIHSLNRRFGWPSKVPPR